MNQIWTAERQALAIAEIMRWIGTPHINRLAQVGVGVDCIQFVLAVLVASEIIPQREVAAYSVMDGAHNPSGVLAGEIEKHLHVQSVSVDAPQFGDIAVFYNGQQSAHVGFITGPAVWHSLSGFGVTRGGFNVWRRRIKYLYRLNQIGFK